jgi:hypothetical protein
VRWRAIEAKRECETAAAAAGKPAKC